MKMIELEQRITPLAIAEVERYDYIGNCGQLEDDGSLLYAYIRARLNNYREYRGKPFSNSKYLHEIEEIKLWKEMGFDTFRNNYANLWQRVSYN